MSNALRGIVKIELHIDWWYWIEIEWYCLLLHLRTILFFVQAVITLHTYFNDAYAREMKS